MKLHNAIYAMYPQVVTVRNDEAFDAQGNQVTIDMDAVNAWVDPNQYKFDRAAAYPSIVDFADAYYWAQKGDNTLMDAYVAKCDDVKTKYPKD
jgi:hypothetical protein